jgi:hypothetical protein
VLIFTASEVETLMLGMNVSPAAAGLLGGMSGGVAQAYATMGEFFLSSTVSCHNAHPIVSQIILAVKAGGSFLPELCIF